MTLKSRSVQLADRLDGKYLILSVDSGGERCRFLVKVRSIADQTERQVVIAEGVLSGEQEEQLQAAERSKSPLPMKINITRVGKRITKAALIRDGLAE